MKVLPPTASNGNGDGWEFHYTFSWINLINSYILGSDSGEADNKDINFNVSVFYKVFSTFKTFTVVKVGQGQNLTFWTISKRLSNVRIQIPIL